MNIKLVMIAVCKLVSFTQHNYGRHTNLVDKEKERNARAVSLAEFGWFMEQPLKVVKLDDTQCAEGLKVRQEHWSTLEALKLETSFTTSKTPAKVTLNAAQIREGYAKTYIGKNGKFVEPEYENVYGFQRLEALPFANALRLASGLPLIEEIPCFIVEYAHEYERMEDCSRENVAKMLNAKDVELHWPTLLKIGYEYLQSNPGAGRSDIQRLIAPTGTKGGTRKSQKIWPILILNSRFPELKIVETILNKPVDAKGVDTAQAYMTSLKEDLFITPLVEGTDPDRKDDIEEQSEEDVAEYFANPFAAEKPVKAISAKVLKNLIKTMANKKVVFTLQSVLKGNVDAVKSLDAFSKSDNEEMEASGLLTAATSAPTTEKVLETAGV